MTAGAQQAAAHEPRVAILMYHSFAERVASPELRPWTVPPSQFAEQVAAMVESGIRLVTAAEVPGVLRGDGGGQPTAVVSIDDAFGDVLNIVGTLVAHDVPATLYVPTYYVGRTAEWLRLDDARLPIAGWSELAGLRDAGVELGSHGHRHIAADVNRPQVVLDDARRSLAAFEDHLSMRPATFAYPFGYENRAARRAIREAGFEQAYAIRHVIARRRDDRFALPRLYVAPATDPATLVRMILEPRPVVVQHALRTVSRLRTSARTVLPLGPSGSRRVDTGRRRSGRSAGTPGPAAAGPDERAHDGS